MVGFRRLWPTRYKRIVYQSRRPWPGKIRKFLFFLWCYGRRGRCLIYDRSSPFCWRKSYYLGSDFCSATNTNKRYFILQNSSPSISNALLSATTDHRRVRKLREIIINENIICSYSICPTSRLSIPFHYFISLCARLFACCACFRVYIRFIYSYF